MSSHSLKPLPITLQLGLALQATVASWPLLYLFTGFIIAKAFCFKLLVQALQQPGNLASLLLLCSLLLLAVFFEAGWLFATFNTTVAMGVKLSQNQALPANTQATLQAQLSPWKKAHQLLEALTSSKPAKDNNASIKDYSLFSTLLSQCITSLAGVGKWGVRLLSFKLTLLVGILLLVICIFWLATLLIKVPLQQALSPLLAFIDTHASSSTLLWQQLPAFLEALPSEQYKPLQQWASVLSSLSIGVFGLYWFGQSWLHHALVNGCSAYKSLTPFLAGWKQHPFKQALIHSISQALLLAIFFISTLLEVNHLFLVIGLLGVSFCLVIVAHSLLFTWVLSLKVYDTTWQMGQSVDTLA
jgi:hypothetical protein